VVGTEEVEIPEEVGLEVATQEVESLEEVSLEVATQEAESQEVVDLGKATQSEYCGMARSLLALLVGVGVGLEVGVTEGLDMGGTSKAADVATWIVEGVLPGGADGICEGVDAGVAAGVVKGVMAGVVEGVIGVAPGLGVGNENVTAILYTSQYCSSPSKAIPSYMVLTADRHTVDFSSATNDNVSRHEFYQQRGVNKYQPVASFSVLPNCGLGPPFPGQQQFVSFFACIQYIGFPAVSPVHRTCLYMLASDGL
jgi:hypothetical protein